MAAVRSFDAVALKRELASSANSLRRIDFLERRLAPALVELGLRWAQGGFSVRHEHFASRVFEEFLLELRHGDEPEPDAVPILLTTLPGELHGLPLSMVAALCHDARLNGIVLGVDTPIEQIADAAAETGARAIAVSVSLFAAGPATNRALRELRARVPEPVELVVGGAGVSSGHLGPRGIRVLRSLRRFRSWARSLRAQT